MSWRERLGAGWERFSDYAIVVLALIAAGAIAFGVYNGWVAKNASQSAASSAATAATDAHQLKVYTIHAHNQNVAYQKQIIELQMENRYLLTVAVYLSATVNNAVQLHSGEIQQLQALTQSFAATIDQVPTIKASLIAGQDQLISELATIESDVAQIKTCLAADTPAACGS